MKINSYPRMDWRQNKSIFFVILKYEFYDYYYLGSILTL